MPPKQSGGSLVAKAKKLASKAIAFAKQEKVLSKALDHFGFKKAAQHARLAGYGKRRRTRRRVIRK